MLPKHNIASPSSSQPSTSFNVTDSPCAVALDVAMGVAECVAEYTAAVSALARSYMACSAECNRLAQEVFHRCRGISISSPPPNDVVRVGARRCALQATLGVQNAAAYEVRAAVGAKACVSVQGQAHSSHSHTYTHLSLHSPIYRPSHSRTLFIGDP